MIFKLLAVYNCIYVVYILCCEINTFGYLLFDQKCIRLTHTYTQQHKEEMSGMQKSGRKRPVEETSRGEMSYTRHRLSGNAMSPSGWLLSC